MATKYDTGNPVGSSDPRDLFDNSIVIDEFANSSSETAVDRRGVSRKTLTGLDAEFDASQADKAQRFNQLLAASGYVFLADYAAGIEITEYNEVIRDGSGNLWRAASTTTLPYTTTGTGLPEGGAFVSAGDAVLRNDLMNSLANGQGALNVRGSVIYVDTIAGLQALPTSELVGGQQVSVSEFFSGEGPGGGVFTWHPGYSGQNDGGSVISAVALQDWIDAAVLAGGVTTANLQASLNTLHTTGTANLDAWVRQGEHFNPTHFGAFADGVTDDTEAVHACAKYSASDSNVLHLGGPGHEYLYKRGIKVTDYPGLRGVVSESSAGVGQHTVCKMLFDGADGEWAFSTQDDPTVQTKTDGGLTEGALSGIRFNAVNPLCNGINLHRFRQSALRDISVKGFSINMRTGYCWTNEFDNIRLTNGGTGWLHEFEDLNAVYVRNLQSISNDIGIEFSGSARLTSVNIDGNIEGNSVCGLKAAPKEFIMVKINAYWESNTDQIQLYNESTSSNVPKKLYCDNSYFLNNGSERLVNVLSTDNIDSLFIVSFDKAYISNQPSIEMIGFGGALSVRQVGFSGDPTLVFGATIPNTFEGWKHHSIGRAFSEIDLSSSLRTGYTGSLVVFRDDSAHTCYSGVVTSDASPDEIMLGIGTYPSEWAGLDGGGDALPVGYNTYDVVAMRVDDNGQILFGPSVRDSATFKINTTKA